MTNAVPCSFLASLLAGLVALMLLTALGQHAGAQELPGQAGLIAADPPPNARLADAPDRLDLTFAAPVDPASVSIRLLRNGAMEVALDAAEVDSGNRASVFARGTGPLGGGDYMVIWSARAAEGGALFAGAYPFQAGIVENPGGARLTGESPAAWAVALRWLVFVGTALAAGGFGWASLVSSGSRSRAPGTLPRGSLMTGGALVALSATFLTPLFGALLVPPGSGSVTRELRAMPLGWWLQAGALLILTTMCLVALVRVRGAVSMPAALGWWGLGWGLLALVGLSFTSHATSPLHVWPMALEVIHQWSAALWISGLVYLLGGWRSLGTDVARFRRVRWIGAVLFGIAIASGAAGAWPIFSSPGDLVLSRFGQVLTGKSLVVLVVLALGLLGMVLPRRLDANRASGSLGAQVTLAFVAALLAAVLALLAEPGTVSPKTLAGIDLVDIIPLDPTGFGSDTGVVHLLAQPGRAGPQTVVVRFEDVAGVPLAPDPAPEVQVDWTPLDGSSASGVTARLTPDDSGALFAGAVTLAADVWWRADVIITPPGGIAGRARFWFILPDPNITGQGPTPASGPSARALFDRGLDSLTSLQAVRFTQSLNDGAGSLSRSRSAVSAANGGAPARFSESAIDAAGQVISEQRILGEERWVLMREDGWAEAPVLPVPAPSAWGERYAGATGFQLGPREEVDGELCQIVTFRRPQGQDPSDDPSWFAWWVGLASGEVRREAMVSTRHYAITTFSGFDAPLAVEPPVMPRTPEPAETPARAVASPMATPTR